MLSENKMVLNAVKRLFTDVCTVYVFDGADGGSNSGRVLFEKIPCRISYDSIDFAKVNGSMERTRFTRKNLIPAAEISSVIRLFVAPEYAIPAGSEVRVFHGGKERVFRASGYPAVYGSHCEVLMVPAEKFV